jgi:threonine dehydrogenase-like Zn-dependent dehydrogenase
MRAGVKYDTGPGNFEIRDIEIPKPGDDEILIKIECAAVCGVDALLYDWTYKGRYPVETPIVPGHECAGVIVEIGKNVKGLAVDDRVTLESIIGCGHCYYCCRGMTNLCPQWDHLGITMDGTFAEYVKAPASAAHKIPDEITSAQGALVEPLSLTAHTFDRIRFSLNDTVVVIGPGVQGLLHVQAARSYGASKIIMVGLEKDKDRLEKARHLGADDVIVHEDHVVEKILDLTKGVGADIVIEVGGTPEAFNTAFNVVRGGGQIAALGFSANAELSPLRLARQQISILGVIAFLPKHFEQAIQWLQYGKVDVESIVSHKMKLDEVETGITLMKEKKASKVLITP